MIVNVESEHLVPQLDHALRYRRFEHVARVSTDTSLAKTREDMGLHTFTKVNHLVVDELLRGIILH